MVLRSFISRDVVLTKKVWERIQKIAILKQLPTHFKAKHEKDMRKPLPRLPPHYIPVHKTKHS